MWRFVKTVEKQTRICKAVRESDFFTETINRFLAAFPTSLHKQK